MDKRISGDDIIRDLSNYNDVLKKMEDAERRAKEALGYSGKTQAQLIAEAAVKVKQSSHLRSGTDKIDLSDKEREVQVNPQDDDTQKVAQQVIAEAQKLDAATSEAVKQYPSLKGRITRESRFGSQ